MASYGNDATMVKIAVFGIAMSILSTAMISILFVDTQNGDYTQDEIDAYRNDLISFSGQSMINQTPWVLKHVYTPWNNSLPTEGHYDDGWLYGDEITDYSDLNKSQDIHLDPNKKSSVPITYTENAATYMEQTGTKWWANIPVVNWIGDLITGGQRYNYEERHLNNWNYTGYRYVYDPTLPFSTGTSTVDGSLSLVWYSYNSQEGLSGGIDVYGGSILLGAFSATDIIADYDVTSSYATTYDFNFEGTILQLSIKFNPKAIEAGTPLMQVFTSGDWSMQISSVSAGNFFDVKNSVSFTNTQGNMISNFIKIFTFSMPGVDNPWISTMLWLMVSLPMALAMLFITLRMIEAVKIF